MGDRTWTVNRQQVVDEVIDGEAVMINITTGSYYCTNATGALVWQHLTPGATPDQLGEMLQARYPGSGADVRGDVDAMLEQLRAEDLIAETDAPGTAPQTAGIESGDYAPPRLEVFTDLQDLLLLDPVHDVDPRGWPHKAG